MYRVVALAGAILMGSIGVAHADPAVSFFEIAATMTRLNTDSLLSPSSNDGELSKESARSSDREGKGGFRTEIETVEAGFSIPGEGMTPAGTIKAKRLMLSGLYELSGSAWRLKPYVGAGIGVIDSTSQLLGQQENAIVPDVQFKGGVKYNITQKLLSSLEWRWSHDSEPTFGIPTKFPLKRDGFLVGVSYKLQ